MPGVIYTDEVCGVLGIEVGTFGMFKSRNKDFPPRLERQKFSKREYSQYGYDRDLFAAFVAKEKEKELGWISSHDICQRLGLKIAQLIQVRKKDPGFPAPVAMKRCMGKKFRSLQFIETEFDAWLENANWEWKPQGDDEDDCLIRYTTPQTRPRLERPVTLELCFITGAFAPRLRHDRRI